MMQAILEALAGTWLIWIGAMMKAEGGILTSFVFKALPVGLGCALWLFAFAHFMGWPV